MLFTAHRDESTSFVAARIVKLHGFQRSHASACVQSDEAGLDAVCHLGRGDMRQTLNILQSVVLAHENITAEHVYLCTGNPPPNVVENIVQWLLNEEMQPAFHKIFQLQVHLPPMRTHTTTVDEWLAACKCILALLSCIAYRSYVICCPASFVYWVWTAFHLPVLGSARDGQHQTCRLWWRRPLPLWTPNPKAQNPPEPSSK